jgi:hypothetical protein
MRRIASRRIVKFLLLGVGLLGWSACGSSDAASAQQMAVKDGSPKLVTVEETGERFFQAVVVNNNSQPVSVAQVEVALFDRAGNQVSTASIEVRDIPANGEKQFEGALNTSADVGGAKVQSILVP